MKKIFSFLGPFFSIIISVGLMFLYVAGLIHSYKKHSTKDFILSICVPPFTVYRGAEMFWHKKEEKNLNDNVKIAVYLLMTKPENIDAKAQLEFTETKNNFKDILKTLDKAELDYVKLGTSTFVEYLEAYQNDLFNSISLMKQTQKYNYTQSEKTLVLSKKCTAYGLEKDIADLQKQTVEMERTVKEKLEKDPSSFDQNEIDIDKVKIEMKSKTDDIKATYTEIFNF